VERRTFLKGLAGVAAGLLTGGCVEPTPKPKFRPKSKPKPKRQRPKNVRKKRPSEHGVWYCENDHVFLYGQSQYDLHRVLHPTHVIEKVK
jgi:hypothetical protein